MSDTSAPTAAETTGHRMLVEQWLNFYLVLDHPLSTVNKGLAADEVNAESEAYYEATHHVWNQLYAAIDKLQQNAPFRYIEAPDVSAGLSRWEFCENDGVTEEHGGRLTTPFSFFSDFYHFTPEIAVKLQGLLEQAATSCGQKILIDHVEVQSTYRVSETVPMDLSQKQAKPVTSRRPS